MFLKGRPDALRHVLVDMSAPRPDWLLAKTGGSTALPALETPGGILLESSAILRFLDSSVQGPKLVSTDPFRHAVEEMLAGQGPLLSGAGYRMIMNRDQAARDGLAAEVDTAFRRIDTFLRRYARGPTFLFDTFGWAEIMLTPTMKRLWFLEYYEGYRVDPSLERLHVWRDACLSHPSTQARSLEEIVKLYHDYSRGTGSGRIPDGRCYSSFTLDPHWSKRPMPPPDKWTQAPTDEDLGLTRSTSRGDTIMSAKAAS